MTQSIVQMHGIKKSYQLANMQVPALREIDLTIQAGEFISIVGPSGSGKSTLMSILGCLDTPDAGTYLLNGINVSHMNDAELTRMRNSGLGFIFQSFNLLPRTTALENVETPLLYAGVRKKDRKSRAIDILARVGLSERAHHLSHQLSGGQQQRVAIARALINNPALLLADEPTGNLDSSSSKNIMTLLEEINLENNVTIILITHDNEVASRAHYQYFLRDGHLTRYT